jgi:hypothetical protein
MAGISDWQQSAVREPSSLALLAGLIGRSAGFLYRQNQRAMALIHIADSREEHEHADQGY